MIRLALLGKNIAHSKSPEIYKNILKENFSYDLLDCSSMDEVPSLSMLLSKYDGLNITAPYKKLYLDQVVMDDTAKKVGCINCIRFVENSAFATNTDFEAFKKILIKQQYHLGHELFLLGDGAMAEMAKCAFDELNLEYVQFSRRRNGELNQLDYSKHIGSSDRRILFINCCSRAFVFEPKLSQHFSERKVTFFDLNYSNEIQKTRSENQGMTYYDGYDLLVEQAKSAVLFWSTI